MQHKKFIKIIVFGIAICALGLRICYVNITAEHPHVETYQMNEWVELNGNFQEESAEETTGYAVRVNSARLLTYKEFIEQYNGNIDCLPESARPIGIVDVEVSVKNTANLNGWLSLYYYMLTSADHTFTLYLNSTLFELAAPSSNGELNIRIIANIRSIFHMDILVNELILRGWTQNTTWLFLIIRSGRNATFCFVKTEAFFTCGKQCHWIAIRLPALLVEGSCLSSQSALLMGVNGERGKSAPLFLFASIEGIRLSGFPHRY